MLKKLFAIVSVAAMIGCAGLGIINLPEFNKGRCPNPTMYVVDQDDKVTVDSASVRDYKMLHPDIIFGEENPNNLNLIFAAIDEKRDMVILAVDTDNDCEADTCAFYIMDNITEFKGLTDPKDVRVRGAQYGSCSHTEKWLEDNRK